MADPYRNHIAPKAGPCVSDKKLQKILSKPEADYKGVDLYPGTYCAGLKLGEGNGRKIVNLLPGTYIIKDDSLAGLAFMQDVDKKRKVIGRFPDGESYFNRGSNITIVGTAYLPTQRFPSPAEAYMLHKPPQRPLSAIILA